MKYIFIVNEKAGKGKYKKIVIMETLFQIYMMSMDL